jgi:hypothetical protein
MVFGLAYKEGFYLLNMKMAFLAARNTDSTGRLNTLDLHFKLAY